jgi:hypothetical protein
VGFTVFAVVGIHVLRRYVRSRMSVRIGLAGERVNVSLAFFKFNQSDD